MDAFERSAEDELGCLGSDSDGEASHDAEAPAPPRHREWSDEEKALVVRECCWPGTRVGEVARRYGLSANQVNAWRALARRGKLNSPSSPATEDEPAAPAARTLAARKAEVEPSVAASRSEPAFAALEVEATPGPGSVGSVSIEARGVTVRLDGDIGALRIAEIAAALRALR